MKPCCCSSLMCSDVWGEMKTDHSDQTSVRMDIALLKEQYNSIRAEQRRQTHVLCFKTAQNSEEIDGENLVDVLPVFQVKRSPSTQAPVSEFAVYCAGGPWRTHLDAHRLTHTTSGSEHRSHVSSEASRTSSDSERLTDSLDLKMENTSVLNSRKSSAPAVLSRQMSFGSYRSTPAGSKHQPFPQRKSLRKSETARRLGLYASL
ncbi:uncharacterized protein LOC143726635 [Siphateles boraxobius]|uniref:uncharacterized protein LOC143726635 n=1 Tax=Siphateles boraxobius TaxID=180520 RepID=UPI0040633F02